MGITSADIGIKVNSRKVMASVLSSMGVTDEKFAPVCVVMDKMDKIGPEATRKELVDTQGLDAETAERIVSCLLCKSVDDLAALCGEGVDTSGVDELKRLFELAEAYGFGDWLVFDASVVRGLAYYTGVVFEGFDRAASCGPSAAAGGTTSSCRCTAPSRRSPRAGAGSGTASSWSS